MIKSLLFALTVVASAQAFATGGWTAISYDPYSGVGNQSNVQSGWYSEQDAVNSAQARCAQRSSNCISVGAMYSGYIALANVPNYPAYYATGTGQDKVTAEQAALGACAQAAQTECTIVVYGYSFP